MHYKLYILHYLSISVQLLFVFHFLCPSFSLFTVSSKLTFA